MKLRTKTEKLRNVHGVKFSIEKTFIAMADDGTLINEWMVNEYNAAKMIAYKDVRKPLGKKEELDRVTKVMAANGNEKMLKILLT